MSGPRVTAPASKLARSLTTSAVASVPKTTGPLLTSSKAAAPLSRKYADLLKERNIEWDSHPRHITTRAANRPHPPQNKLRLMQTFTSAAAPAEQTTMDAMMVPDARTTESFSASSIDNIRVPLLPDNFAVSHAPEADEARVVMPEINVVAANPEMVTASALTEVEGMGVDGVELKFVHEEAQAESGSIQNMWKGLVDDVLGSNKLGGGPRLAV